MSIGESFCSSGTFIDLFTTDLLIFNVFQHRHRTFPTIVNLPLHNHAKVHLLVNGRVVPWKGVDRYLDMAVSNLIPIWTAIIYYEFNG